MFSTMSPNLVFTSPVCDDHEVKDTILFYRFRRDDVTYIEDKDLVLFYQAFDLYNG